MACTQGLLSNLLSVLVRNSFGSKKEKHKSETKQLASGCELVGTASVWSANGKAAGVAAGSGLPAGAAGRLACGLATLLSALAEEATTSARDPVVSSGGSGTWVVSKFFSPSIINCLCHSGCGASMGKARLEVALEPEAAFFNSEWLSLRMTLASNENRKTAMLKRVSLYNCY